MTESILDSVAEQHVATDAPPVDAPVDTPDSPAVEAAEWYFADGVKGEGQRPEWLKDKYKSMADQAKAYTDLEKKFGELKGSPDDGYNFDNLEGFSKDDPMLKHFSETFKEMNLSQEGFERVVNDFMAVQEETFKTNIAEEMKKLGPQAESQVKQVNNWIDNTFDKEVGNTIKNWVMTADDVKALEALRAFQPRSAIPSGEQALNVGSYESSTEVKNEMTKNWGRYNDDENYRATIKRRLTSAVTREGQGKR